MPSLSGAEIDHDLGAIGGVFPDPKRRRLVEKLGIAVEDDEVMEEDEKQKMEEIRKEKLGIAVEDDEVMEEEDKQKMEEIRKEEVKLKPELDMDELLRIAHSDEPLPFGLCSRDSDAIMNIRDRDSSDDVVEEEEEVDEKDKETLDNVEKASFLPSADFFLLPPSDDSESSYVQINSRRLDIFYKRLVPNVKSARNVPLRYFWNRLPEVDSQYVYLFTQFDKSVHFQQNSWHFYVTKISHANRRADFLKALDIAKTLNLDKLNLDNIHECFVDVFIERDTIAKYKLKTEYDLFLLECRNNQNLHPKNFAPKDRPPIMDSPYFVPSAQQQMFDSWMEKNCSGLSEEECQIAIRARYEKELNEDCSTRIRYIRYKRGLAKELGLIPAIGGAEHNTRGNTTRNNMGVTTSIKSAEEGGCSIKDMKRYQSGRKDSW